MIWSIHKGITWSFYQGKLFSATAKSGEGHRKLHNHNSLPLHGTSFDRVERGRAAAYKARNGTDKTKLVIEVVSLGVNEHLSNGAYEALLKHFGLSESQIEIEINEPGWDNEVLVGE